MSMRDNVFVSDDTKLAAKHNKLVEALAYQHRNALERTDKRN